MELHTPAAGDHVVDEGLDETRPSGIPTGQALTSVDGVGGCEVFETLATSEGRRGGKPDWISLSHDVRRCDRG